MTSLISALIAIIAIIIPFQTSANNDGIEVRKRSSFMEPCITFYTQEHCDEDDEDYPSEGNGDECAPITSDNCDRSLQLFCVSGICLPNCHPTREQYDPETGKCFKKIGSDCKVSEECEPNAVCERRSCACGRNFTIDPQSGKCVRAAEFGEFCDESIVCHLLSDMACLNSTCQCRSPESQYYHAKRKRCYLLLGQDCTNKLNSFQFCPDNSDCIRVSPAPEEDDEGEQEPERYIGILEEENKGKQFNCICNNGQLPTVDGKSCLGSFGTGCNSLHKCNTERSLKCFNNGKCQCSRPLDQRFDPKSERCVNVLGASCQKDKEVCGDWTECKGNEGAANTCQCINGFSPGFESEGCLKDHGTNCSTREDDVEPICNILVGLVCSNFSGSCKCQEEGKQYYDVKLKRCRDFEVAERKIPATHFDLEDREYLFKSRSSGQNKGIGTIVLLLALKLYLISININ